MEEGFDSSRRPLKSRGSAWSRAVLALLLRTPVTANQISCASMLFATLAGVALYCAGSGAAPLILFVAIVGIQGRLLCNLMDGMVAVEGQRSGKFGALYNEIPDRVSDVVILLGAGFGYAAHPIGDLSSVMLGWIAALLAILTAYVRLCGVSIGVGHIFVGPMAKPHRMALLTVACLVELILIHLNWWIPLIPAALLIISIGCVITLVRRMQRIADMHGGA